VCSSFRECGLVHFEFIFTTAGISPVIAIAAEKGNQTQPTAAAARPGQMLFVKTGTVGLYTLTLVGGCRQMSLIQARYLNKVGAIANMLRVEVITQVDTTGVFNIGIINSAGTAFVDSITNNDEIHFTVMVDK
jgi:hypothetical protein